MKRILCLFALISSSAMAALPITIAVNDPDLYPASSSIYLQSVIPGLIQAEIDRQCGIGISVSELDLHVHLHHNEVPGMAGIEIAGTAICR